MSISGSAFSAVPSWRNASTYAAYMRGLPVQNTESVVIGPGKPVYQSLRAGGEDSLVMRSRVEATVNMRLEGERGWVALMMPCQNSGEYILNGRSIAVGDACLGGKVYESLSTNRDVMTLAVRETILLEAMARDAGVDADDCVLATGYLPKAGVAAGGGGDALARVLMASTGADEANGVYAGTTEIDLIDRIVALLSAYVPEHPQARGGQDSRKAARAALDAAYAIGLDRAGISHMCAGAGVRRTRLHEIFVEVYGVSASQYLRSMRLSRAREMLLDPEARRSVKNVALSLGFMHSGRFAAAYHAKFGEWPSETLSQRPS